VDLRSQLGAGQTPEAVELRRHRRFKLEVDIRVYPRESAVVRGHTVDISESGISAMLREEVPLGAMVRLEFALPLGEVEVLAMVRHRNAFRYGFQFVEASSADDIIGRTCRQFAVEQG
jgi:PilZ domain-containing protein